MSLANHRAWRAFGGNICCSAFDGTSAGRARQVALPGPDRHAHRDGPGGRASARSRARARLRVVRPALAGVHPKAERAASARTYHEVREPTLASDARRLEVQPDTVAAPATDPRAAQVLALQRTVGNRLAGARSLAASRRRAGQAGGCRHSRFRPVASELWTFETLTARAREQRDAGQDSEGRPKRELAAARRRVRLDHPAVDESAHMTHRGPPCALERMYRAD
jgi:hypothetical protein